MSTATADLRGMRRALALARRAFGETSPNPRVGAVIARNGVVLGEGYHSRAGEAHAEVEAIRDAKRRGKRILGATLYVSLEPCSTQGRTPPCTAAILAAGIGRVVVAAVDPNPQHAGRGLQALKRAGVLVEQGLMAEEATRLNEAFNHWIVHRTPFVCVKAAMTLDGKIATARGESKWITGSESRAFAMRLRQGADAILVGVNTILLDDPSLTIRALPGSGLRRVKSELKRVVLDSKARTPVKAKVLTDGHSDQTIIVVSRDASARRVAALRRRGAQVWVAPQRQGRVDLGWVLKKLGALEVTQLLVEGGGEVNASFLLEGWAHRVAFFYAPKVLGGRDSRRGVAGDGVESLAAAPRLHAMECKRLGADLFVTGLVRGMD